MGSTSSTTGKLPLSSRFQGTKIFFRNSISAELPSNTTNKPNSNITRDQNETQVTVPDNAHLNNSRNDNSSWIDFHEEPIDFAEPSDNETDEPLDFIPTTTSTSSTTVTSTTSTMTSTTSTTATTETSTTKELFIARNKASSVLNERRLPRSYYDYHEDTLSEWELYELGSEEQDKEEAYAKYYNAFVWFQIFIFYSILFHLQSYFLNRKF